MKQTLNPLVRTCHSCLRELPAEAFYVNRKTQVPDYCCKECRSAASKKRYMDSHSVNDTHMYPVITDTPYGADPPCPPSGKLKHGKKTQKAAGNGLRGIVTV